MTFRPAPWPRKLRSQEWFEGTSKDAIYHRSWMKNQGLPPDLFDGRPVIGILQHLLRAQPLQRASARPRAAGEARGLRGGRAAGRVAGLLGQRVGLPPTAMMFRNLAAMAVEETIRGQPMDGVVCLVGCDKTTPSLLMGAASTTCRRSWSRAGRC
jgi:L-arabonate dehydrase